MTPLIVLIASAALGVEAGWQPLAGGGHEYTIQIEPSLLGRLTSGNDLYSVVPPQVNVRQFRITVETGALARIDGPPQSNPSPLADTPRKDDTDGAVDTDRTVGAPSSDAQQDDVVAPGPGAVPAKFRDQPTPARPLEDHADGIDGPKTHVADKPRLENAPITGDASQPWMPFLVAAVLLACSLGVNFYLGWIAWDARSRYLQTVSKLRAAPSA